MQSTTLTETSGWLWPLLGPQFPHLLKEVRWSDNLHAMFSHYVFTLWIQCCSSHIRQTSALWEAGAWRISFRRRPHLPQVTWKHHQTFSSLNGSLCSNTKAVWLERQADAVNKRLPWEPSLDTARESDIRKKCRGWKSQRRIKTIFPHSVLQGAVFFL